ncbi:MAG: metallophosphoesterase [Polymorphobacter sp.]|uniref:metallophosphoesterase n=1 Tax=Polymorphobacter sp. TaxID=1909290 RepID=UPI003A87A250
MRDPLVVTYRVPIEGLSDPLRLVHLSDVHASPYDMPLVRVRRIVGMVNGMAPDIVVLTGDYHGGKLWDVPGIRLHQVVQTLGLLDARLGTVAVAGNHDQSYWISRVFADTEIRMLRGDFADLGPLVVAGADSIAHHYSPAIGLRLAIAAAPAGKPLISISHEPETGQFAGSRSQLHLAGHAHGGQIIVPGLGGFGPLGDNDFLHAHRRGALCTWQRRGPEAARVIRPGHDLCAAAPCRAAGDCRC